MSSPYVIGLTGNIATGKSTVLRFLAVCGAHVIDADQLAHAAIQSSGGAFAGVVAAFGPKILGQDGEIQRAVLGQIVFGDPAALKILEALVHPQVYLLAQAAIAETDAQVVVLEAIKLLEAGSTRALCDEVWVLVCDEALQIERLASTRQMSVDEARRRMAAQSSQADKVALADRVIENNGSLADLHKRLAVLWGEIGRHDHRAQRVGCAPPLGKDDHPLSPLSQ